MGCAGDWWRGALSHCVSLRQARGPFHQVAVRLWPWGLVCRGASTEELSKVLPPVEGGVADVLIRNHLCACLPAFDGC